MTALTYHAVAAAHRALGGDPLESARVPDEVEASRPVDLDDCSSCDGQGLIEVNDWMGGAGLVDVSCPRCGGTGERGAA